MVNIESKPTGNKEETKLQGRAWRKWKEPDDNEARPKHGRRSIITAGLFYRR